jgi:hypothetical protein
MLARERFVIFDSEEKLSIAPATYVTVALTICSHVLVALCEHTINRHTNKQQLPIGYCIVGTPDRRAREQMIASNE